MQTLFSLKPNMCLTTNYCVIVPPKPSSIRDFPTELVSRYRQDYHHFKVGILESFVLSLFVLQSYQHEVINDINNSYPLQNKKKFDCFQSKLVALQLILASFFLTAICFCIYCHYIPAKKEDISKLLKK